jgi:hypothetical protein
MHKNSDRGKKKNDGNELEKSWEAEHLINNNFFESNMTYTESYKVGEDKKDN